MINSVAFLNELRAAPLRSKLQLASLAISATGLLVILGSGVAWAIWSRIGGPVMLFDPRFDLCQSIGMAGFVMMALGACALGLVHGDSSFRSRLGRYGAIAFWGSLLAMTALPHMSIAELSTTLVGRVLISGLAVGVLASAVTVALDLAGKLSANRKATVTD